jgi:hypothetical protein
MKLAEKIAWRYFSLDPAPARAIRSQRSDWCPGWESNPVALLKRHKLLILRVADYAKNAKSAKGGYAAGTWDDVRACGNTEFLCKYGNGLRVGMESSLRAENRLSASRLLKVGNSLFFELGHPELCR